MSFEVPVNNTHSHTGQTTVSDFKGTATDQGIVATTDFEGTSTYNQDTVASTDSEVTATGPGTEITTNLVGTATGKNLDWNFIINGYFNV